MLKIKKKEPARMWSLRFYDSDRFALQRIAKKEGVSTSNLIRQVLRDFIQRYEK